MHEYLFDSDYSSDHFKWLQFIQDKNLDFKEKSKYNNTLDALQSEIIQLKNSSFAYFFSTQFNYNLYKMQKVVLDSKDPKYCFLFAQNIDSSDIKALQSVVASSKNIKYICKFACFVKGANTPPLERLVLNSKNYKYTHMLLKYISPKNISKYKPIIIESEKPRYLFELAKHTKSLEDLSIIEDLIIKSKSYLYIRLLASKIKNTNIEKLEQSILESNNTKEIKKFAISVKKSKMKQFLLVI